MNERPFGEVFQPSTARSQSKMGLTGLEPVTLRLSSACSNQLSYKPGLDQARAEPVAVLCADSIESRNVR